MRSISTATAGALAFALLGAAGCASHKPETFVATPYPVEWRDLTDRGAPPAGQPYKLLANGPTVGVFPGSLAVARVAATAESAKAGERLVLDMVPPVDFLAWNSVFDDYRAISEVFPLNHMALNGAPTTSSSLVNVSGALGAELLLVYAENRSSMQDCDLRGVIFDVKNHQPLAAVESAAHVDAPIADDAKIDREHRDADSEEFDPRQVAVRQFQQSARNCMLALMSNDKAGPRTPPEGWVPNVPIEPLTWPPSPSAESAPPAGPSRQASGFRLDAERSKPQPRKRATKPAA